MDDLELVLNNKVKPLIESATKKVMGVSIAELNKSLLDTLEQPLVEFDLHDELPFKEAKKLFKKQFFAKLIQTHFGNISEVAKISCVDRRSIHRTISELKIDTKKLRHELLMPNHYRKLAAEHRLKEALNQYKKIIRQEKLDPLYAYVHDLSEEIIKELPNRQMSFKEAEKIWETQYIERVLGKHNGNITATAKDIGLRYETLHRKMKSLGINV